MTYRPHANPSKVKVDQAASSMSNQVITETGFARKHATRTRTHQPNLTCFLSVHVLNAANGVEEIHVQTTEYVFTQQKKVKKKGVK
mmetsp:Transcript_26680/g.72071  ORF Transcript_26680/g.72071 Transcript_26680/m.72071 type:complete len:86 (+) Transcript_26680:127-384(+)|eukprot:1156703-Pelagomonas_calceolata.AAC.9